MESRKRPLADVEDTMVSKKRILTGSNGSPHVNGDVEAEDEVFGEKLEVAIFLHFHLCTRIILILRHVRCFEKKPYIVE